MKFYGVIGFAAQVEEEPGLWVEKIVPRTYYGDVKKNHRSYTSASEINDDIRVSSTYISVVSDGYLDKHIGEMKYIEYLGCRWKIQSIEVSRPRVEITLGEIWHGQST